MGEAKQKKELEWTQEDITFELKEITISTPSFITPKLYPHNQS
jgi:hypothetical protein